MNEQKADLPSDASNPKKKEARLPRFGQVLPFFFFLFFFFFFCHHRDNATCVLPQSYAKQVHSPQGPGAYYSLNLPLSRPASSKGPATCELMESF